MDKIDTYLIARGTPYNGKRKRTVDFTFGILRVPKDGVTGEEVLGDYILLIEKNRRKSREIYSRDSRGHKQAFERMGKDAEGMNVDVIENYLPHKNEEIKAMIEGKSKIF